MKRAGLMVGRLIRRCAGTVPIAPRGVIEWPARRIIMVAALVLAAHVGLLVFIFIASQREPINKPIESQTIIAELISEKPTPVATPVALRSSAALKPVSPKPHYRRLPVEQHTRPVKSTRTPARPSDTPSSIPAEADRIPAPPTQVAPAAVAPAVPAIAQEFLAINTPKDISHLDCNIAKPDYPYQSKHMNETGTAVIRFVIGLTGTIEDIQLQRSSGYPRLDNAALDAMHSSACRPYMEDGKPVRATYSQPFVFSLNG